MEKFKCSECGELVWYCLCSVKDAVCDICKKQADHHVQDCGGNDHYICNGCWNNLHAEAKAIIKEGE